MIAYHLRMGPALAIDTSAWRVPQCRVELPSEHTPTEHCVFDGCRNPPNAWFKGLGACPSHEPLLQRMASDSCDRAEREQLAATKRDGPGKTWTEIEVDIVRREFPLVGAKGLFESGLLPGRTIDAIRIRASSIGVCWENKPPRLKTKNEIWCVDPAEVEQRKREVLMARLKSDEEAEDKTE